MTYRSNTTQEVHTSIAQASRLGAISEPESRKRIEERFRYHRKLRWSRKEPPSRTAFLSLC
jgi:hypothetical protein